MEKSLQKLVQKYGSKDDDEVCFMDWYNESEVVMEPFVDSDGEEYDVGDKSDPHYEEWRMLAEYMERAKNPVMRAKLAKDAKFGKILVDVNSKETFTKEDIDKLAEDLIELGSEKFVQVREERPAKQNDSAKRIAAEVKQIRHQNIRKTVSQTL